MIEHLPRFIDFLETHDMSPSQFLLCWILYLDKREHEGRSLPDSGPAIANIYRFVERVAPWPDEEIRDLVQRGYLIDQNVSRKQIYPDHLAVTDKFVGAVLATESQFEQLWDAYHPFMENDDDPRQGRIPHLEEMQSRTRAVHQL